VATEDVTTDAMIVVTIEEKKERQEMIVVESQSKNVAVSLVRKINMS
jgi:hypothetical protein